LHLAGNGCAPPISAVSFIVTPSPVPSIFVETGVTDAVEGTVHWSFSQLVWLGPVFAIALIGGIATASVEAFLVFLVTTAVTLCLGHSLGMHRRYIHQSYGCPKWLEYVFVHCGVLVGLGGPLKMLGTHDTRDWAQRQPACHPYFSHRSGFFKDGVWQLFCEVRLSNPPVFIVPKENDSRIYRLMERTWLAQQIPLALLLWYFGGVSWVIWGSFVRVAVSCIGHWLIGYFAHTVGHRSWHVTTASVQGFNIPFCGLITMGECWHNNHHAYPGSAKLGLSWRQSDPGWWLLLLLRKVGLVWDLQTPADLATRPELVSVQY
jgi:fatty-acid desaturase